MSPVVILLKLWTSRTLFALPGILLLGMLAMGVRLCVTVPALVLTAVIPWLLQPSKHSLLT
jgi:hypothetical protein